MWAVQHYDKTNEMTQSNQRCCFRILKVLYICCFRILKVLYISEGSVLKITDNLKFTTAVVVPNVRMELVELLSVYGYSVGRFLTLILPKYLKTT